MTSFISSFKKEGRVLACVAAALLLCELGLRATIGRASIDVAHIDSIPQIVTRLSMSGKPSILFLGNSLTRAGVIPKDLAFPPDHVALIHPDDSTIADWLYLYERQVAGRHVAPDLLVVPFAGDHLSDTPAARAERLGDFGGFPVAPDAFSNDIRDFDGRVSYVLAALSTAYANRERVRTELFARLIPRYKESAQAMNRQAKERALAAAEGRKSYGRLARFLRLVKSGQTKVVFVAMPTPRPREIDPTLRSLIAASGADLIDLRKPEGLTDADYSDGYHLKASGGALFTRALSRRLLERADLRAILERK